MYQSQPRHTVSFPLAAPIRRITFIAVIADQWKKLNRVAGSLSDIVADMPPIDYLDKLVITAFQKHRLAYRNDATLKENFIKPPVSVDMYLELLDNQQLRKQLIDDPNKFRTLILSMFVSSYNESDDSDE